MAYFDVVVKIVCTSRKLTAIGFSLWRPLTDRASSDAAAHASNSKYSNMKHDVASVKVMRRLARRLESVRQPRPVMRYPCNGFCRLKRGKPTLQQVPLHWPSFKNRLPPGALRMMFYETINAPPCDPDAWLDHKERERRRGRLRQSNADTYFPGFGQARQ
jgi:hypothetical protein